MPFTATVTEIPGVLLLQPTVVKDERGFFLEAYNRRDLAEVGIEDEFVQDNHSRSVHNVLRGLHYQVQQPQGKLVRAVSGEIFDVVVDLRRSSPTFRRWIGMRLSAEDHRSIWVPPGLAHGFLVLSDSAEVLYKTTAYYAPQHERSLLWSDPELAIQWPLSGTPMLSQKDADAPPLSRCELYA